MRNNKINTPKKSQKMTPKRRSGDGNLASCPSSPFMPMEDVTLTPLAFVLESARVYKEPKMTLNPPKNLGTEPKRWDAEQQYK